MGRRVQILIIGSVVGVVLLSLAGFVLWRSDATAPADPVTASPDNLKSGFSFFDVGAATRLTDPLRESLESHLGSDAIAYRMPLTIELNYPGFLNNHFPQLDRINRDLNAPFGERREHDTVTLMYRRARKKKVPFEYVELVFSNVDKRPLLFKIQPAGVGKTILEALVDKYGEPRSIPWGEDSAETLWWTSETDLLFATIAPDRFGKPEYQFRIVFTRNIEAMIQREKEAADRRAAERRKAGETAF